MKRRRHCPSTAGNCRSIPIGSGMLGIELLDAGAIAVNVDDNGTVRARSDAAESDLAVAALAALARLSAPANAPAGGASASPESAPAAAAVGGCGRELQAQRV